MLSTIKALEDLALGRRFANRFRRLIKNKTTRHGYYRTRNLIRLENAELLSLLRHDCHRIEKSFYNGIFQKEKVYYSQKLSGIRTIIHILEERAAFRTERELSEWIMKIESGFENLQSSFIDAEKKDPVPLQINRGTEVLSVLRERRSCRVWSSCQPALEQLRQVAEQMIDAARWSPNSGNRQPWRFSIVTDQQEKNELKGLKEEHCYNAPLLIFVGMDRRFYQAAGHLDNCLHIDAGVAASNMVTLATFCGFGTCWNHFSRDLIESRHLNAKAYRKFASRLNIPDYVEPVALIAVGIPAFIPPGPVRLPVSSLLISQTRTHP